MNRSWSITIHVIRTMQVFDNMHTWFLELAHRAVVGQSCGLPLPEKNDVVTIRSARLFRQTRSPLRVGATTGSNFL